MNYKDFLRNKKVSVVGIGPHGEMVADIKFLLRNKAIVSIYDMRSEKRIKNHASLIKGEGLFTENYGKINPDDLLSSDLILLSPEISKKSFFLKKALDAGIQIEFPETLFFKLSPSIILIGVMGIYGKSTVSHMLYSMLKKSFSDNKEQGLFFIDPDSTNGAITHLKKIKKGDVVLARIPEELIYSYYDIHISPHVAVITSKVPFNILEFQTHNNFIVAPDDVVDDIKSHKNISTRGDIKAKILRTRLSLVPEEWLVLKRSEHDRVNSALALQASELFKVSQDISKDIIQRFAGLKGRMEFIKKVAGIDFYNDSASVTPYATLSALKSLFRDKNTILIIGGAYTRYDYESLANELGQYTKLVILLPGSGSIGFRNYLENIEDVSFIQAESLEDAVSKAKENGKKGDNVLFSPAFEAIGIDISRKERGDRFVKAVRAL